MQGLYHVTLTIAFTPGVYRLALSLKYVSIPVAYLRGIYECLRRIKSDHAKGQSAYEPDHPMASALVVSLLHL